MNKIYACYIVYNEADKIALSLNSIISYVDKVVMVDGAFKHFKHTYPESTDDTKEIAEKICGDKLIWIDCPKNNDKYIPWENQVDKRNAYLENIPLNAWFYVMDSDVIVTGNIEKLFNELREQDTYRGDEVIAVRMINFYPVLSENSREVPPKIKQTLWKIEDIDKSGLRDWYSFKGSCTWKPNLKIISPVNWIGYYGPVICIYKKLDSMQYKYHHAKIYIEDKVFTSTHKWTTIPYILSLNMKMLNSFERHSAMAKHKQYEETVKSDVQPIKIIEEEKPLKKLLICTPFCNESHSINKYIGGLIALDYPKGLIDLIWVENNSSDNTWELLKKHKEEIMKTYTYNSFTLYQKTCDLYNGIEKQGLQEYGETGSGGKVGKNNSIMVKRHRPAHQIGIWNDMINAMTDKHDYILFIFADCVIQEDTVKRFLKDFETYPNAGWFGGVMHKRYPRHRRYPHQSPMYFGLASPSIKVWENMNVPTIFKKRPWWIVRHPAYPYGIRGMDEEEIIELQKSGNIIFEICCSGHIFMLNREVIRKGFKFKLAPIESGLAVDRDLDEMGYKMYCDSYVYIKHISVDGKIYRESLEAIGVDEKEMFNLLNEDMTESKKEIVIDNLSSEERKKLTFIEFLVKNAYKNVSIPMRPSEGTSVFDKVSRMIISSKQWDEFYGDWGTIIENSEVYKECRNKAKIIMREMRK